jgi:membrane protein implicated in regulation of membrane protease activity
MELYLYIICLGVGFVFTLATVFLGHLFGGGHDLGHVDGSGGHAEAGLDGGDMPGISIFSPMVIACFVAAFGGLGIIFHEVPATQNAWMSAPLALAGACAISFAVVWLIRKFYRATDSSSESKVADAIGIIAQVITPIPPNGVGEIAYVQKGARYSAPARESAGNPVANGSSVRIVRVAGSQFYVIAA